MFVQELLFLVLWSILILWSLHSLVQTLAILPPLRTRSGDPGHEHRPALFCAPCFLAAGSRCRIQPPTGPNRRLLLGSTIYQMLCPSLERQQWPAHWSAINARDGVLGAAFSPDGKRVVTASEDFTATVWDAMTGQRLILRWNTGNRCERHLLVPTENGL